MALRTLRDKVTIYMMVNSTVDRYGDTPKVRGTGTVWKANVQPVLETRGRDSGEFEIDRDTLVNRFKVTLEPWAIVDAYSQIVWDGRNFEVIGSPSPFKHRNGVHHLTLQMREIVGG